MPFNTTKIKNLYCVGDSCFPGQGLNAVAFSGYACAHKIGSKLNINSFNLPVTAEYFCAIYSVDELASANAFAKKNKLGVTILGEGTNIILPSFVVGLVIKVEIKGINIDDSKDLNHPLVTISAGENWHNCVKFLLRSEIYGVENLSLIPGSVGASVIQNIGAYGVELSDVLSSVEVFDLKTNRLIRLSAESCGLSYRDSIFKNERQDQYVITSITLKLYKSQQLNLSYPDLANYFHGKENPTPSEVSNAVITIRRNKLPDPQFEPNVGSFFKNPIISRGRLHLILSKNNGYAYFWESIFILHKKKYRITQIPVQLPYRKIGSSKMNMKDIFFSIYYL